MAHRSHELQEREGAFREREPNGSNGKGTGNVNKGNKRKGKKKADASTTRFGEFWVGFSGGSGLRKDGTGAQG